MYICKEKNYKRKESGMADVKIRFFNKKSDSYKDIRQIVLVEI